MCRIHSTVLRSKDSTGVQNGKNDQAEHTINTVVTISSTIVRPDLA
jgi:hypothetical protein